jgi:hypothetical protein
MCTEPLVRLRLSEAGLMCILAAKCGIVNQAGICWRRDEVQEKLEGRGLYPETHYVFWLETIDVTRMLYQLFATFSSKVRLLPR